MHHLPKRPKDEAEMDAQCPNLLFAVNADTLCKTSCLALGLVGFVQRRGIAL